MAEKHITTPNNPELYNPPVTVTRSTLEPSGTIDVYRITSDQIHAFLSQKVSRLVPTARAEVLPRYCERKKSNPRRSYAAMIVALSSDTIEQDDDPYADTLGIETENVRMVNSVHSTIIRKYGYDRQALKDILNDYRKLDELEEAFGMTESFVRELYKWSKPIAQKSPQSKETWIMFSARADAIIEDMLTPVTIWTPKDTSKGVETFTHNADGPVGRMEIVSVTPINKESVEFIVYVHRNEFRPVENNELRKLLSQFNG